MLYSKKVGRIELAVYNLSSGGNAMLSIPSGWNDHVEIIRNELTREELYDLRYLIDRAIAEVERQN